jgi:AraC-like DNA-binding protein
MPRARLPETTTGARSGETITALVEHPLARERLASGFGTRCKVAFVRTPAEVFGAFEQGRVRFVVLETSRGRLPSTLALLAAVRERFVGLPVVCYWTEPLASGADLCALAHAGATTMVLLGVDDTPPVLRALCADLERRDLTERLLRRAREEGVHRHALDIVRMMLLHAHRPLPIDEVAMVLGITRRTLLARLDRAGLPSPRHVAGWCRVMIAAHTLAVSGRSVERVAAELDFPSSNALRNLMRRYSGMAPRSLRKPGALERVQDAFLQAVRPHTCAAPARRPVAMQTAA